MVEKKYPDAVDPSKDNTENQDEDGDDQVQSRFLLHGYWETNNYFSNPVYDRNQQ